MKIQSDALEFCDKCTFSKENAARLIAIGSCYVCNHFICSRCGFEFNQEIVQIRWPLVHGKNSLSSYGKSIEATGHMCNVCLKVFRKHEEKIHTSLKEKFCAAPEVKKMEDWVKDNCIDFLKREMLELT